MDKGIFQQALTINKDICTYTRISDMVKKEDTNIRDIVEYIRTKDMNLYSSAITVFKNYIFEESQKKIEKLENTFNSL